MRCAYHLGIILFFSILTQHVFHSARNRKSSKRDKRSQIVKRNLASTHVETTFATEDTTSPALSNEDLAQLLTSHGFKVKNFTDGPPLAFMGDRAYYPWQVLPSLPSSSGRSMAQNERLWIDANGQQQVWYFYDSQTQADQKIFEQAVKIWADSTCIQFHRGPPGGCNESRGHGAVCVGSFDGCWSMVGNMYEGGWTDSSQKMSVQNRCDLNAGVHEFGHALGLHHQQSRPDRDQYIWVNMENYGIKSGGSLKYAWEQADRCDKDQTVNVPSPYDYMSVMQYATADFAKEDARMIYVTRDPHNQYMLDYHRSAGITLTHYDKLVMNVAYKCDVLWRQTCGDNGSNGPKCLNGGYFSKKCKCECPSGYSGSNCGSKTGEPLFPVLDRAKVMLDVTTPGSYDLANRGMTLDTSNLILEKFAHYQFLTIVTRTDNQRKRATILVKQPYEAVARQMFTLSNQNNYMEQIGIADCGSSTWFFFWGDSEHNKMRTECISSVYNNELPDWRLQLRGRNRTLSMVVMSALGLLFGSGAPDDPVISLKAAEFKLDVTFHTNPAMQLRTFKEAADNPGPLTTSGEATSGGLSGGAIAGIVIGVVLGVLAVVGVAVAWKMGKLPSLKRQQAAPVQDCGVDGVSGDSGSDSDSDFHRPESSPTPSPIDSDLTNQKSSPDVS